MGAGPYKVVSFKPGLEIVLEAHEGYWRKTPSVKRLVLKSIPEEATRFAALKSGDVDIAFNLRGPLAEAVKSTARLRLDSVLLDSVFWLDLPDQWDPKSPGTTAACGWRPARPSTSAWRGRAAASSRATSSSRSRGCARFQPEAGETAARRGRVPRRLDAGDFYPFPAQESQGEAMANNLAAVGIRARIRTLERASFIQQWSQKKLRGIVMGTLYPAPLEDVKLTAGQ